MTLAVNTADNLNNQLVPLIFVLLFPLFFVLIVYTVRIIIILLMLHPEFG